MSRVSDLDRKRSYQARPSRRVSDPTRPFAIRLGGKQADWLDDYLSDLAGFTSKTQKLSAFVAVAIEREAGVKRQTGTPGLSPDMDTIKDELEHTLKRDLKKWLKRLLNDRQQFEVVQNAHTALTDGGEVDDAVIENILQGFDGEY